MNLPPSITPEIYQRAVMFATDWRPGRPCDVSDDDDWIESKGWICPKCSAHLTYPALTGDPPHKVNPHHFDHDIPIPPLTDKLIVAMLRKGQKRDKVFVGHVSDLIIHEDESLDAAIILAAASMEKEG